MNETGIKVPFHPPKTSKSKVLIKMEKPIAPITGTSNHYPVV